jgi:hypothetical protein
VAGGEASRSASSPKRSTSQPYSVSSRLFCKLEAMGRTATGSVSLFSRYYLKLLVFFFFFGYDLPYIYDAEAAGRVRI